MDKVPKKNTVSFNFTCALFSLLAFSTLVLKHQWGFSTLDCMISQKSADLTRQFGNACLGLALCGVVQSDLVWHFIHELKTPHKLKSQLLRINLVFHSNKYSYIIQLHIKYMNRLSFVWLPLTSTPLHSLLWEYHIWFMPTFWGMQLGHKTRPGHANMQHWRINCDWCLVCMFL